MPQIAALPLRGQHLPRRVCFMDVLSEDTLAGKARAATSRTAIQVF